MKTILQYFPDLTSAQIAQFEKLDEIYKYWNERINLISRKDIDQLYNNHILHSLAIAKVFSFKRGIEILDIGTGGGFPGIPLAIFFSEVEFTLCDSIGKKVSAVNEIIKATGLKNANTIQSRAEELKGSWDFVTCRAVARLPQLWEWTRKLIAAKSQHEFPNGLICLKGGKLKDELKGARQEYRIFTVSDFFSGQYFQEKKIVHLWKADSLIKTGRK